MTETSYHFTNRQLANIFENIADLLEIKGENRFKTLAYRKAAESLLDLGRDAVDVWREGQLEEIPGVGKAISEKIDELFSTGKLDFYEKLTAEVPLSLIDLLEVPGLGHKKVALFWQEKNILTLDDLEKAASAGELRELPGMGAKSEAKIIKGLEALSRRTGRTPLGDAWPVARELITGLEALPQVEQAEVAGSLRRMKETVGDLDILAASSDPEPVMDWFTGRKDVVEVISKGPTKSSVEFDTGIRAQLWVHPPEKFGTALQYATGSKDHNVRLREIAQSLGMSLSDQSIIMPDGKEKFVPTEAEVYSILGLPWVPPELREDRGEIQAIKGAGIPDLITREVILADLHTHTDWSDGKATLREMVEGAIQRGFKILAVTDHSQSLGIANGLSPERLRQQRLEIDEIQSEYDGQITILQGAEVEIKANGSLDYPDDILAELDIVVASLHTSLTQSREQISQRLLNAITNPHVDIIGHPTGRMIPDREGADLDMDAILNAAAENDVALEINANPVRLDLNDIYSRRLIEVGGKLAINTDAHWPEQFDLIDYGIATARRAWIKPGHVINTWGTDQLLSWLQSRG